MRALLLAGVGLAIFFADGAQAQTASQPAISRAQIEAASARQYLAAWRTSADNDCLALPINEARYALARISALVTAAARLGTAADVGRYERTIYLRRYEELSTVQLAIQLEIADAYLAGGCLADADKLYRDVLIDFTSARHAAARQRAQIGIDDVRFQESGTGR